MNFSQEPLAKFKILFEGKARGGENAERTWVREHFSPTINAAIGTLISER